MTDMTNRPYISESSPVDWITPKYPQNLRPGTDYWNGRRLPANADGEEYLFVGSCAPQCLAHEPWAGMRQRLLDDGYRIYEHGPN